MFEIDPMMFAVILLVSVALGMVIAVGIIRSSTWRQK